MEVCCWVDCCQIKGQVHNILDTHTFPLFTQKKGSWSMRASYTQRTCYADHNNLLCTQKQLTFCSALYICIAVVGGGSTSTDSALLRHVISPSKPFLISVGFFLILHSFPSLLEPPSAGVCWVALIRSSFAEASFR